MSGNSESIPSVTADNVGSKPVLARTAGRANSARSGNAAGGAETTDPGNGIPIAQRDAISREFSALAAISRRAASGQITRWNAAS